MPEGAVYVGRPTKWGNPFSMKVCKTRAKAKRLYRAWLVGTFSEKSIEKIIGGGATVAEQPLAIFQYLLWRGSLRHHLDELRGKDLMCWCPLDQPCHADVLLEIANAPEATE
jgi:hypothetical protein